jgi:hypothetical protein
MRMLQNLTLVLIQVPRLSLVVCATNPLALKIIYLNISDFILEINPIAARCAQNHLLLLNICNTIAEFTQARNHTNVQCV